MKTICRHLSSLLFAAALAAFPLPGPLRAKDLVFRAPQAPVIPQRVFKITDFGAAGDGVAINTAAFRKAIEACTKAGGGRVIVPAGRFLTGPIELAGHMALVVEKDAVIQASDKFADFGLPDPLPTVQSELDAARKQLRPLISGVKLEDVAILGEGIIDGAGAPWWAKSDKAAERAVSSAKSVEPGNSAKPAEPAPVVAKPLYVPRPHLIVLRDCARVQIAGVTPFACPDDLKVGAPSHGAGSTVVT